MIDEAKCINLIILNENNINNDNIFDYQWIQQQIPHKVIRVI